jgi:protein-S-isoprenylcysteine O-methyltransferase Ste14
MARLSGGMAGAVAVRFTAGAAVVLALLLVPAGTVHYWQAWVYLGVLLGPMLVALGYLVRRDPALLERRLRTKERRPTQTRVQLLGGVAFVVLFVLAGLDHRLAWSRVPAALVVFADVLVLSSYAFFIRVLRENSYASRVIEVTPEQRVVSTGPYAVVRHPMYTSLLVLYLATPVALGSWWAIGAALPLVAVLVIRINDEERLLADQLGGYREYREQTRYRLVPGVW